MGPKSGRGGQGEADDRRDAEHPGHRLAEPPKPGEDEAVTREYLKDIIPHVEKHYRAEPGRENRAFAGMSIGGFVVMTPASPASTGSASCTSTVPATFPTGFRRSRRTSSRS